MSLIYRGNEDLSKDDLKEYLIILESSFGDTINKQKPRNYFACSGKGYFEVDMSNMNLNVGCSLTFILNFRIRVSDKAPENQANFKSNLISISFSNEYNIDFDLNYPIFFVVKEIKDDYIKSLPVQEWINLIINIYTDDKNNVKACFYINGENSIVVNNFKNSKLVNSGIFKTIKLFNNFNSEVSSMTFLSQKDYDYPGVNSNDFLLKFRGFKEGLWKQKKLGELIQILSEFDSIGVEKVQRKTLFKSKNEKIKSTNTSGKLINNVIFIFTPLNYFTDDKPQNIIENVAGNLIMKFFGNIRVHKYYCFQKRLGILGLTNNLLPISEMLLIRPELLDEKNFELF